MNWEIWRRISWTSNNRRGNWIFLQFQVGSLWTGADSNVPPLRSLLNEGVFIICGGAFLASNPSVLGNNSYAVLVETAKVAGWDNKTLWFTRICIKIQRSQWKNKAIRFVFVAVAAEKSSIYVLLFLVNLNPSFKLQAKMKRWMPTGLQNILWTTQWKWQQHDDVICLSSGRQSSVLWFLLLRLCGCNGGWRVRPFPAEQNRTLLMRMTITTKKCATMRPSHCGQPHRWFLSRMRGHRHSEYVPPIGQGKMKQKNEFIS